VVHVEPDAHAVGPVYPLPPHWPYIVCVAPLAVDVGDPPPTVVLTVVGDPAAVVLTVVGDPAAVVLTVAVLVGAGGGVALAEPAGAVGTVDGCCAVFQVAVVGHAVVAIVSTGVPYGVGPGMLYVVRDW